MGSVIYKITKSLLVLFYSISIPAFLYFGFQPIDAQTVYAEEAAEATETLEIHSLNFYAPVKTIRLENHELISPEQIVGSYHASSTKTLLIGHSTTIFEKLNQLPDSSTIFYNSEPYKVISTEIKAKQDIDMTKILAPEDSKTIILMTCAGEQITNTDFSHRLIITAKLAS